LSGSAGIWFIPLENCCGKYQARSETAKNQLLPAQTGSHKKKLDIEGLDHLYPAQLSGGQRQRVALARALLLNPMPLLLDEPFAAIDTVTRERLQNQLLDAFQQRHFSYIIVTHNIEEAVFLGRRIIVLDNGIPSIKTIIENPGMGDSDYRNQPAFFNLTKELRKILEETV
jgi:NitT/TauT family transport system ATP-binding protein